MDVDRSLDEMITEKRGKTQSQPRKSAPRVSTGSERRAGNAPYARPPPRSTEDKWVHDAYQGPAGGRGGGRFNGNGANPAIVGTGAVFTGISTRIEVIGLHYEVTPADLKNIFSQAGTLVQGPTIRYDRSGRSKGEATMEYASPQQAKIAINKFDGAMTKGQTISIRLLPPIVAKGRPGPPAAAGGAPGGGGGQSLLARIQGNPASAGPVARGGRGGRGGPARGGRGGPAGRGGAPRGPKRGPTNEGDLDKELDNFMNKDAINAGDVEMA
ncbi:hypothetical protein IAR55_004120 [Kwoniella newhampshirensis]|uniref:RRM domain-containing protein n=1 Tax=Kwoniella newhampshirensis TaxID=1651941 RepID=A0AAW0YY34_9TREE